MNLGAVSQCQRACLPFLIHLAPLLFQGLLREPAPEQASTSFTQVQSDYQARAAGLQAPALELL